MISAVSSASAPNLLPKPQPSPRRTARVVSGETAGHTTDTVQISNAAWAMIREAIEIPAQTAKEAAVGDHQAMRLKAKEAAARASEK